MFIYTGLIFAVALILIILAFFGQTNLTALRKSTAQLPEMTEIISEEPPDETPGSDALAVMTNTISALDAENGKLKTELAAYDSLLEANAYIEKGDKENAGIALSAVVEGALTENQKILYDQIKTKINE